MSPTSLLSTPQTLPETPTHRYRASPDRCGEDPEAFPVTPTDLLELQALLARQPNLVDGMKALTGWFGERLPGANVRLAWGAAQPKALFDYRLGKLGPESSLWNRLLENWPRVTAEGIPAPPQNGSLWMPFPSGNDRAHVAVLWVEGSERAGAVFRQLAPAYEAVGTVLWSRPRTRLAGRWALGKGISSWRTFALIIGLLLLAMLPVPYRVSCHAVMQPWEQRIIAAPFEATLLDCFVEPGDEVKENELLLVLDGRPLQLELEALKADLGQAIKQQSSALATGKIAESQLAELERRQLEKRIELYEDRLACLEVRSPMDGVVVSGDLARSVGTPLEIGKPLLEIAPLERMLIEVEIPEEEIQYVSTGDPVRVRLDASMEQAIEGRLRRVFPQAEVREERNVFVGRWEMANRDGWLRPGMQGTAVVYGPRRPLAWPWIRQLHEAALRAVGW